MGKILGFKEFGRQTHQYDAVEKRVKNYSEFLLPLSKEQVQDQGARCMECGTPFCHPNCPLNNLIPDWNDLVYKGRWEDALQSLWSTNNFPEFTGRICPAPCEAGCVLGIISPPVAIKSIEYSIIEEAWKNGFIKPVPPAKRSGKKVAVIGSGPSGLAAADQLNKAGHAVTVYERASRIGGLLRYGIPDFKLDKKVIDRRVKLMEDEGVKFVANANIGVNIPAKKILEESDAVVMACGATIPRDLPIPGRNLKGIRFAMEFLGQSNMRVAGDKIPAGDDITVKGKHVVVIGGGDTGSDCVGTSIRQGAASVTQIELLPKPPEGRTVETAWPVYPGPRMFSTSSSQAEGCARDWSILSKEFIDDGKGNVAGIKAVRLEWEGMKFKELPGTELTLKADAVFLAMGFLYTDPASIVKELGVELDQRGNVKTGADYQSSVKKVFSAGDCHTGQSLVVSAIAEGRECAREVDKFLSGGESLLPSRNRSFYTLK